MKLEMADDALLKMICMLETELRNYDTYFDMIKKFSEIFRNLNWDVKFRGCNVCVIRCFFLIKLFS